MWTFMWVQNDLAINGSLAPTIINRVANSDGYVHWDELLVKRNVETYSTPIWHVEPCDVLVWDIRQCLDSAWQNQQPGFQWNPWKNFHIWELTVHTIMVSTQSTQITSTYLFVYWDLGACWQQRSLCAHNNNNKHICHKLAGRADGIFFWSVTVVASIWILWHHTTSKIDAKGGYFGFDLRTSRSSRGGWNKQSYKYSVNGKRKHLCISANYQETMHLSEGDPGFLLWEATCWLRSAFEANGGASEAYCGTWCLKGHPRAKEGNLGGP